MSIFQGGRFSALLFLKEKRCRKSHGVRVQPVWGLLVIISFISGHSWPAQSYIICLSEPRNRRTDENLRRADCKAGKDWLSFPCSLSGSAFGCFCRDHSYLALSRNCCPFAEKNTLKKHIPLLPVPLCCDAQPWQNPGVLHCRRRSGSRPSWSPHSTAHGLVDRLLRWVCDFSVLIHFFLTAMYFINIFSHHSLTWTAYSPILQRFPLPHIIHSRGI